MDEFRKRIDDSIGRKEEQNYYYMSMDSQRMLDAGPRGNIARFINHSCDPNAETQKWTVNNDTRVGLFALEDIPANTELTFNYQFESMGEVKKACLCGAKNCSGFIGKKSKKERKEAKGPEEKKDKEKKKKKKKFKVKVKKHADKETGKKWEDLCFRYVYIGFLFHLAKHNVDHRNFLQNPLIYISRPKCMVFKFTFGTWGTILLTF